MKANKKTAQNRAIQAPARKSANGKRASANRSKTKNKPQQSLHEAKRRYQKYIELARKETMSGDAITAENYRQHAEHYYRVLSA